jgi:organic hydroperoxide reductase OsmC/OhrA
MAVKLTRKEDRDTFDFGLPILDKLSIDYAGIPEEKRSGLARALLSASALSCYVSTLSHELKTRGVNADAINAETEIELKQNEIGQNRIKEMKLKISVKMNKADAHVFDECAKIMQNGCLATSSIHEGIPMKYNLTPEYEG